MCCLTLFSAALCDSSSSVLHVRQTTDFFLDTNCRGNCSSFPFGGFGSLEEFRSLWSEGFLSWAYAFGWPYAVWYRRGLGELHPQQWLLCICWREPLLFHFFCESQRPLYLTPKKSTCFCKLLTSLSVLSGSVCKTPISTAFSDAPLLLIVCTPVGVSHSRSISLISLDAFSLSVDFEELGWSAGCSWISLISSCFGSELSALNLFVTGSKGRWSTAVWPQ